MYENSTPPIMNHPSTFFPICLRRRLARNSAVHNKIRLRLYIIFTDSQNLFAELIRFGRNHRLCAKLHRHRLNNDFEIFFTPSVLNAYRITADNVITTTKLRESIFLFGFFYFYFVVVDRLSQNAIKLDDG